MARPNPDLRGELAVALGERLDLAVEATRDRLRGPEVRDALDLHRERIGSSRRHDWGIHLADLV